MKKTVFSRRLVLTLLLSLTLFALVSANNHFGASSSPLLNGLGNLLSNILSFLAPLFTVILGEEFRAGGAALSTAFIINLMIFIIIFVIVFSTTRYMPMLVDNDFIRWVITIAVTILATRWLVDPLTQGFIEAVLLPYSVFGISLTALLPFVIMFWFVEVVLGGPKYRTLRKICWIFFAVVFFVLWILRANAPDAPLGILSIYPIAAILCLLFFFLDRTIQGWWYKRRYDLIKAGTAHRIVRDLEIEAKKVRDLMQDAAVSGNTSAVERYRSDLKKIEDQIIKHQGGF